MKHVLGWISTILLLILCGGCASIPNAIVTPGAPRQTPLVLGINDGWHGPIPADVVAHECGWGSLVARTPQLSAHALQQFMQSTAACPTLQTLALVEGPDTGLAAALASVLPFDAKLEVGNELELAPNNLSQAAYATAVAAMRDAARAVGFIGEIIAGAVYAITDDTKARVAAMMVACPDCSVGLHIYEDPTSELGWIRSLGRRVWVTETGSPTGCGTAEYQAQADFVRGMTATLSTVANIVGVVYYQRPSGAATDCSDLATFGFQASDGSWKPVESVFAH